MMLDANALLKKTIEVEGKKIDTVKSVGWQFGDGSKDAKELKSAVVKWPAAKYGITWSTSEKRWLLTFNGKPNLDSTGRQLGSPNFVIQKVSITDSIYGDKFGGVTPMSNTVGSGTG
jgi:hypothetical protein